MRSAEIVREVSFLSEEHAWFVFDLRPLANVEPFGEIAVQAATEAQLPLVEQMGHSVTDARVRYSDGATLWISIRDQRLLSSCWIYRDRVPVMAAQGGWLTLPDGVVWQEDSVISKEARGLGLGMQLGATLYCQLAAAGATMVLTKIPMSNVRACKAAAKVGFVELATVRLRRRFGRKRVLFTPTTGSQSELARELGERLVPF